MEGDTNKSQDISLRILEAEAELVWRLVVHHNGSKNYHDSS